VRSPHLTCTNELLYDVSRASRQNVLRAYVSLFTYARSYMGLPRKVAL
jgi:hypothetical protein